MSEVTLRLQEVTELISLPEVYLKVRQLMDDETSDIYDFAEVISVDPNLSTRVLKIVNSAYFGFPEPVDNIARAINMIGIGQLHNMVLGISAISSLDLPNDILPLDTFWRVSLFSGVLARLLAEQIKLANSDQLFITGLLHEIGHLVLYSKFPLQVLAAQRIEEEQGKQIHEAEMQVLGYHYGDIGAMLMANWNLSENLQSITRNQPDPAAASDNQVEAALMHVAHACAHSRTTGNPVAADNLIDAEVLAMIGLTQEQLESSMDEARSISADMEKIILP
jgi:HD-like signal output (HDOD) protein